MASPTPLSEANTTFSLALLKKFGDEDKTANIFFSPFSISSALAMVMLGARGNTATQMSEVLCFTEAEQLNQAGEEQMQTQSLMQSQLRTQGLKPENGKDDVHASFSQLLSELNKEDAPYALSLANRLYGEQSYQFVEDFLSETRKHYNAELESVDFKTNAEDARVNINSWVEKETQGKIKDLLEKGIVGDMTMLVLVNAIYFKGNWEHKFKEDSTKTAKFTINKKRACSVCCFLENDTKSVKMMRQKGVFRLSSIPEANCQILEMPYEGKELSMLIFLPNQIKDDTTGLEKLERELTYEKFVEWTRSDMMYLTEVEVKLPRFKMEETYDLKDVLTSMGMVDAFDVARTDFSGMSPANDLMLSEVIHKAFVEVNEEGTEAAAATAAPMIYYSLMSSPKLATFIADHPFLFFIRHNPTMSVLFAGRYCSPE